MAKNVKFLDEHIQDDALIRAQQRLEGRRRSGRTMQREPMKLHRAVRDEATRICGKSLMLFESNQLQEERQNLTSKKRQLSNANLTTGNSIRFLGNEFATNVPYSINKKGRWSFPEALRTYQSAALADDNISELASKLRICESANQRSHRKRRRLVNPTAATDKMCRHESKQRSRFELELQLDLGRSTNLHLNRLILDYTQRWRLYDRQRLMVYRDYFRRYYSYTLGNKLFSDFI